MNPLSQLLPILLVAATASPPVQADGCPEGERLYRRAAVASHGDRIILLRRSIAACPTAVAAAELGHALMRAGQPQAAVEALILARNHSDDAGQQVLIHTQMAAALYSDGHLGRAVAAIDLANAYAEQDQRQLPPTAVAVRRAIDDRIREQGLSQQQILRAFAAKRSAVGGKGIFVAPNTAKPKLSLYVMFDTDADLPLTTSLPQLRAIADALVTLADGTRFLIIGHADLRGSAAHNQSLSERRARAVARMLEVRHGALDGRIDTVGRGETQPRYAGNAVDDLRRNRRVEVALVGP